MSDIQMKAFNVTNHKLNATQLSILNRFMSDDFCGAMTPRHLNKVFFKSSNGTLGCNIGGSLDLINGGVLFSLPVNGGIDNAIGNIDDYVIEDSGVFFYIKYPINMNQNVANIYSDEFTAEIASTSFTSLTYIFKNKSGDVVEYDNEQALIQETEIAFADNSELGESLKYTGQTLIINGNGIIPLFAIDSNHQIISILAAECKSSFEDWLSAQSLDTLWEKLHATFVHQSGSTDEHKNYGVLGNLRIEGNTIYDYRITESGEQIDKPILELLSDKNVRFCDYSESTENNVVYENTKGEIITESSGYLPGKVLYAQPENGQISIDTTPVYAGGTGATTRMSARRNLGIMYGYGEPPAKFKNDISGEEVSLQPGDIYFKVL